MKMKRLFRRTSVLLLYHDSDSVYVFGTHRGGIIGMNTKGRALFELSTDNLLLNDNINDLFIDKWNNVWVSLNNGLSRIEIYSAFSYFSTVNGVKGGVSDICRFNNKVYIATTQGLRYLDKTNFQKQTVHGNMFKLVKEIQVDCNKLLATPSGLLVSTDNGLYFIDKNDKVQVVNKEHIFEDFLAIDSTYKQIVICLNNGLGIIEFKNNKPIFRQLKTDFFDHTRTIAKDAQGSYWLGSDYNGVYNVSIDLEKYSVKTIGHYKTGKGFPANIGWVDVYSTQRGVLFSTQSGPFLLIMQTNHLLPTHF
jgi:ligand-binding sensor domain-containing protein